VKKNRQPYRRNNFRLQILEKDFRDTIILFGLACDALRVWLEDDRALLSKMNKICYVDIVSIYDDYTSLGSRIVGIAKT
jgi:hypothetical protein